MLAPLANGVTVTVTRRTRSGVDAYGNDVFTSATVTYDGCGWWPGSAGRNVAGSNVYGETEYRASVVTRGQVTLPDGADVRPQDFITTPDGALWRVVGEAQQWGSQLTGSSSGIQVGIERVDG